MKEVECKVCISKDEKYCYIEVKDQNGESLFEVNLSKEQFINLMMGEDAKGNVITPK